MDLGLEVLDLSSIESRPSLFEKMFGVRSSERSEKFRNNRAAWYGFHANPHTSDFLGAQCCNCGCIVWVNPRENAILQREQYLGSAEPYQTWREKNIQDFVASLPLCPECEDEEHQFECVRTIDEQVIPALGGKLQERTSKLFDENGGFRRDILVDAASVKVWCI